MAVTGNTKSIGVGPQAVVPYVIPIDESGNVIGASGGVATQVQGNVAAGAADSGNPVKVGGKYNATVPTLVDGNRGDVQLTSRGSLRTLIVGNVVTGGDAISNLVASAGADNGQAAGYPLTTAPVLFNGSTFDRLTKATATSRIASAAATTNATSAKASAGTVYALEALNTSATLKYLKLYNKASAPTVGTDTPVRTIAIPPSNGRAFIEFPTGLFFSTGIAYALTGAAADADATALAAGDVVGLNIDYS